MLQKKKNEGKKHPKRPGTRAAGTISFPLMKTLSILRDRPGKYRPINGKRWTAIWRWHYTHRRNAYEPAIKDNCSGRGMRASLAVGQLYPRISSVRDYPRRLSSSNCFQELDISRMRSLPSPRKTFPSFLPRRKRSSLSHFRIAGN